MNTGLPIITSPLVDTRSGQTKLDWYLFFNTLTAGGGGGGTGTVQSVNITGTNGIGVSGAPITTSGTIALTLTSISTGQITCAAVAALGTVTALGVSVTNTVSSAGVFVNSGTLTAANATVTSVAAVNLSVSNTVTALGVTVTNTVSALGLVATNTVSAGGVSATNTVSAARVALTGGTTSIVSVTVTAGTSWTMTLPTVTGTVSQVLQTDGTGLTSWITVSSAGGSGLNDQIILQEQQNSGTAGSGIYASGGWRKVVLNTNVADTGSNVASFSGSQFALVAGSYEFEAFVNVVANTSANTSCRIRLRNTTDSTTVVQGTQQSTGATALNMELVLTMTGYVVIAAQKTFEIDVYPSGSGVVGGAALTTGDKEIYATIRLRRYA